MCFFDLFKSTRFYFSRIALFMQVLAQYYQINNKEGKFKETFFLGLIN